jgi:DNA-binding NtrC family response regulator
MKQAAIIAYGIGEPLSAPLRAMAHDHGFSLRVVQHVEACKSLWSHGWPAVFVLMVGKDLGEELSLLQQVGEVSPDVATVVVGETSNPALAALAWDLGARCVLQPPQPLELLPEIVLRFLAQAERGNDR